MSSRSFWNRTRARDKSSTCATASDDDRELSVPDDRDGWTGVPSGGMTELLVRLQFGGLIAGDLHALRAIVSTTHQRARRRADAVGTNVRLSSTTSCARAIRRNMHDRPGAARIALVHRSPLPQCSRQCRPIGRTSDVTQRLVPEARVEALWNATARLPSLPFSASASS